MYGRKNENLHRKQNAQSQSYRPYTHFNRFTIAHLLIWLFEHRDYSVDSGEQFVFLLENERERRARQEMCSANVKKKQTCGKISIQPHSKNIFTTKRIHTIKGCTFVLANLLFMVHIEWSTAHWNFNYYR